MKTKTVAKRDLALIQRMERHLDKMNEIYNQMSVCGRNIEDHDHAPWYHSICGIRQSIGCAKNVLNDVINL